jgi:hypothetical protein
MIRVLLALTLSGCAAFDGPYAWSYQGNACEPYAWMTVSPERLTALCGKSNPDLPGTVTGCRMHNTCIIVSRYTEAQAATVIGIDGLSVREHELKHIAGWIHTLKGAEYAE